MAILFVFAGLLGLVVGSFLNVVVYRVPLGMSVVRPPSRCPGCEAGISPRDNVPVLSWVLLRGRCRQCRTRISARYPAVELATAGCFVAVAARFGLDWQLLAFEYFAAIAVALALIDIAVYRLPDVMVLPSIPITLALLAIPAGLDHRWDDLGRAVLGGLIFSGVLFVLAVAKPGGMGLGDVKLGAILGMLLAWLSWGHLAGGFFAGFLLGAIYSIFVVIAKGGNLKSKIPFGPFLLGGTLLFILVGQPVIDLYVDRMLG